MKQKLVLLIALALALFQGLAAQDGYLRDSQVNPTNQAFRTYVGQEVTETVNLSFTEVLIPINPDPDPDDPVVRSSEDGETDSSGMLRASLVNDNYSISIEGSNNQMFSADMIWAALSSTTNKVTVKMSVTYTPTEGGIHKPTLYVIDKSGNRRASVRLYGEAMILMGDADSDGKVSIADVTSIIDYILNDDDTDFNADAADIDYDGTVSIADASDLLDIILDVSQSKFCTFVIIEKTDGNIYEYMIDENSKVKILEISDAKWLNLEIEGISYIFPINSLEQWRYEQREVTLDNSSLKLPTDKESEDESMTKANSLTLKTEQP